MSTPKLVRVAQSAVFNQFMTREAISSATFRPAEPKMMDQPKMNIRIHDESTHLKFGFPKTEKVSNPNSDDFIQLNCEKLIKEEQDRQCAFLKLTNLRF
ncbi:28S ribosomal protein S36, mitochondrial [Caenorhabditis elegans]|uniref:28S ribosomal protein S36, mitochondrial n=1 Tax=Caenorhabditis elegans TaxID=6239 RepID=Q20560_CAEEL|nr:28S ribosomal protein S36, mitochondrial [Caenorhabditis elegans]CCD67848.1 28S ribosomal protein S36, mitochondrial [Caenorhabditis elegans]|eukprot:NP_508722.1 Uncharacterized protein CELE_F48D6.4 [Caenorhabditis elegans]